VKRSHIYIATLVCLMYMLAFVALMYVEPRSGAKDALLILIGGLSAAFGAVVNYFFGSSTGSADKTVLMNARGGLMPERKAP
jgi:lipopolysaccharide export LptBFGC system permease protein LptF